MTDTGNTQALLSRLGLTVAGYCALIAACRASVAADARGDADPLAYVRHILAEHGQVPPEGTSPLAALADARSALCMAGWPSGVPSAGTAVREREYEATGVPCGCLLEPGGVFFSGSCTGGEGVRAEPRPVRVHELALPGERESAGTARAWAARVLGECPARDDLVLALSESVANSVLHSRAAALAGSVTVRLIVATGAWIRAEVRDGGPPDPRMLSGNGRQEATTEDADEHGRGLPIVRGITQLSGTDGTGLRWFVMTWAPVAVPAPRSEITAAKEPA